MPIEVNRDSGTLIIHTEERVDSANAQTFFQELETAIESDDRAVVMDMERLSYISSAGLRVILQTARKPAAAEREVCHLLADGHGARGCSKSADSTG